MTPTPRATRRNSRRFSLTPIRRLGLVALLAAGLTVAVTATRGPEHAEAGGTENVIMILTDDQTLQELAGTPIARSLIGGQGVTFSNAYASFPLCCPSRATMFSGQYMHNHGVRGNAPPYGSYQRFIDREGNSLGPWLQDAGYYTTHIGKYMNSYMRDGVDHVPPGWNEWYGKVGTAENSYTNYTLMEHPPAGVDQEVFYGDQDTNAPGTDYQTDVYKYKALDFLDRVGVTINDPFYLSISFGAPHGPYQPAARHLYTRSGYPLAQPPAFNEKDISDKPVWLQAQAKKRIQPAVVATIAAERRRRLEQLLAVDEATQAIVDKLAEKNLLNDTYIIFTSDNGFFRGEHRIVSGKFLPYDAASHIPLMIRGPGIPAGQARSELVANVDIPETVLDIAGAPATLTGGLDGRSFLPYAVDSGLTSTRPILFEGDTGPARGAGEFSANFIGARRGVNNLDQEKYQAKTLARGSSAPAFRGIRTKRYAMHAYSTGDIELYDMLVDSAQKNSLAANPRFRPIRDFLLGELVRLSLCDGAACREQIGTPPLPLPKSRKARSKPR